MDVCRTSTRGKHPSLMAWPAMEKDAVIMAWLAMTAANVAMMRK